MPTVHPMFWRLARFGIVGVTVMVFFTGLNWLFGHWLGKDASFILAYPPAVGLHFWLNRTWTFASTRTDSARQVSEYLLMVFVTFLVQAAVFKGLTTATTIPGWAAAGISNLAQMLLTFLAMQFRVFRSARDPG
jgi:putative flippase GtrA